MGILERESMLLRNLNLSLLNVDYTLSIFLPYPQSTFVNLKHRVTIDNFVCAIEFLVSPITY